MSDTAPEAITPEPDAKTAQTAEKTIGTADKPKPKKPPKPTLTLQPTHWIKPTCNLPGGEQSKPYAAKLEAFGGASASTDTPVSYTFVIEHSLFNLGYDILPDGLELVKTGDNTAEIKGIPSGSGTYLFTVKVEDGQGSVGSQKYSIAVAMDLHHYHSPMDRLDETKAGADAFSLAGKDICTFDKDDKDGYPLALSEFLAYKAAQAYNSADIIDAELVATEKETKQKFEHFRFFDSTVPMTDGTPKNAKKASGTPVPERWFAGIEKRRAKPDDPYTFQERRRLKKIEKARNGIDTQAFGFVFEGKAFIISRGTVSLRDWRTDIDTNLTDEILPKEKITNRLLRWVGLRAKSVYLTPQERTLIGEENLIAGEAGRHIGFASGWAAISDEVEAWVNEITAANGGKPYQYIFSGHSLGGALSFVGAHSFAKMGRDIFAVITFGAPSVGRKKETVKQGADSAKKKKVAEKLQQDLDTKTHFVDEYNDTLGLADCTIRLQAIPDFVPVSLRLHGFSHVGRVWHLHFPPLPAPFKAARKRWIYRPILATGQMLLRADAIGKDSFGTKVLSYAMLHGAPFVAKLASAHSSESRYAIFLSALSYRKIRAARTGNFLADITESDEAKRAEQEEICKAGYPLAKQDYETHLDFIRGKSMKKARFSKKIKNKKRARPRMIPHHKKQQNLSKTYYGDKNIEYLF